MSLINLLSKTIAIDAGSENLRIIHNNQIVFNQKTRIAIDLETKEPLALGDETFKYDTSQILKPVNHTINDFFAFEHLLKEAIAGSVKQSMWLPNQYKMYFVVPSSITEVEKRSLSGCG